MKYARRPLIAISSCLLGHRVRYDGTAKRDRWVVDQLGKQVDYQPICPEVAIGLGTPRPPIRLVGSADAIRVLGVDNPSLDVTDALERFALHTASTLGDVSGYVFTSKSPSCGMRKVKVRGASGRKKRNGIGVYARMLMHSLPNLPCEEDRRLKDPMLRENFINRVFAYRRWQSLRAGGVNAAALLDFHARHRYMVMAHSQAAYRRLDQMLLGLEGLDLEQVADAYERELMTALKRRVSRERHAQSLLRIQADLKGRLDGNDTRALSASIGAYRREEVPLAVPMGLVHDFFRRSPDHDVDQQSYFDPYPEALGLRNTI